MIIAIILVIKEVIIPSISIQSDVVIKFTSLSIIYILSRSEGFKGGEYMERFVNGKEFQRLIHEANPDGTLVIQRQLQLLKKIKRCTRIVCFHLRMLSHDMGRRTLGKAAYIRKRKRYFESTKLTKYQSVNGLDKPSIVYHKFDRCAMWRYLHKFPFVKLYMFFS